MQLFKYEHTNTDLSLPISASHRTSRPVSKTHYLEDNRVFGSEITQQKGKKSDFPSFNANQPIQRVKFFLKDYRRGKTKIKGKEYDTEDPGFAAEVAGSEKIRIKNQLNRIVEEDKLYTNATKGAKSTERDPTDAEKQEAQQALANHYPAADGGQANAAQADADFKSNRIFKRKKGESPHEAFYRNIDRITADARKEGAAGGPNTDLINKFLADSDPESQTVPNARHNRALIASRVRVEATKDQYMEWGSGKDELFKTADTREFIARDAGLRPGIDPTSELSDGSLLTWMQAQKTLRAPTDSLLWSPAGGGAAGHSGAAVSSATGKPLTVGQADFHEDRGAAVLAAKNPLEATIIAHLKTLQGTIRPEEEKKFKGQHVQVNAKKGGDLDNSKNLHALFSEHILRTREQQKRRLVRFAKENKMQGLAAVSPARKVGNRRKSMPKKGISAMASLASPNPVRRLREPETPKKGKGKGDDDA